MIMIIKKSLGLHNVTFDEGEILPPPFPPKTPLKFPFFLLQNEVAKKKFSPPHRAGYSL